VVVGVEALLLVESAVVETAVLLALLEPQILAVVVVVLTT
jgi:hypothetical protein